MYRNYITIALRNLFRNKMYSIINIVGLSIGIACFTMLMLYVQHELGYDRHHDKSDRIYRLVSQIKDRTWASIAAPIAPGLASEFPEILYTRLWPWKHYTLKYRDQSHYEDIIFADASIFKVFSFSLLQGNINTALREPNTIVISKQMAIKYFGNTNPLGQTLVFETFKKNFKITGILKDIPSNSHFKFDCLISFSTLESANKRAISRKNSHHFYTYLLLPENLKSEMLNVSLNLLAQSSYGDNSKLILQPLTDIHLHSNLENEIEPNSDILYVYILSSIAVLILLIACINFTNLTTAQSLNRTDEISLRKVVGASRTQLIKQFLGESILFAFLSVLLAWGIVYYFLPWIQLFATVEIGFNYHFWDIALFVICSVIGVGTMAGIYPAFYLSKFEPIRVVKKDSETGLRGIRFRQILIVFQFSISIMLIIATSIVYNQLNYIASKRLGFAKEQVIVLPISPIPENTYRVLKDELLKFTEVSSVTISDCIPGTRFTTASIYPEGSFENTRIPVRIIEVGYNFLETLGIELLEGRDFSEAHSSDITQYVIINQTALTRFNWSLGERNRIKWGSAERHVIGVVKDFHFASFRQNIEPLVFVYQPADRLNFITIKLRTKNIENTLDLLKKQWRSISPGPPFEYFFIDEYFARLHQSERKMGRLLTLFSLIAITMACLGLFGLASFAIQQRTKEIGIRRILGATVTNIVMLFSKEYMKLVSIASLIAWPVAYYAIDIWLQNFSYRITPNITSFTLSTIAALAIALLTVGIRSYWATRTNPVDLIRYE